MARKSAIKATLNATTQTLRIDVEGMVAPLVLRMADVHPDNATYAMLHGFKQRIVDAAALPCNEETGKSATPAEKYEAMARLVAHYAGGSPDWSIRAAGGGGETGGLTLRALAAVQGVDVETMRERVERNAEKRGISVKAYLAAAAKLDAVRAKMDEMRPAPAIDAGDMLDELAGDVSDDDESDDE